MLAYTLFEMDVPFKFLKEVSDYRRLGIREEAECNFNNPLTKSYLTVLYITCLISVPFLMVGLNKLSYFPESCKRTRNSILEVKMTIILTF